MIASLRNKMFGGAMWSGAGKILSMMANFAITLVLARALTPGDYGVYFVAVSTIVIMAGVGTLGMDQIAVRFVAMHLDTGDYTVVIKIIRCCLGIVVLCTVVCCVLFFAFGRFVFEDVLRMPSMAAYVWVMALWIFFATLQRQLAETFRGLHDIRFATLFGGIRNVGIINAILVCIIMSALWSIGYLSLLIALFVMLFVSIVVVLAALGTLGWYVRRMKFAERGISRKLPGRNISFSSSAAIQEGWPLWLGTLTMAINMSGGIWIAGLVDTADHVALFGVAQRLIIATTAPIAITNAILPPVIARLHSTDQIKRLEEVIRTVSGLILICYAAFIVVLLVFGEDILKRFFGEYYDGSYYLMVILSIGQLMVILAGSWRVVLPMTGGRHQFLLIRLVSVISMIALSMGLGMRYGVLGVACGCSLGNIITNLFGLIVTRYKLGIWTHAKINMREIKWGLSICRGKLGKKMAT